MISFVVPAHNEENCLARTLAAIHGAARALGELYEVVVVDDASTDATAEIARQHDARVVSVNHRQIAATRNSGARAAAGERLFFVDADTTINARVVAAALRHMDAGAAGGGALVRFGDHVPLYARLMIWWMRLFMRLIGLTGGAFMFSTRAAFDATGGFDERLYGAEDAAMCWALKRVGRFVLLWECVLTSGRRARGVDGLQMVGTLLRAAFDPKMLTRQDDVKSLWYDSNRGADDAGRNSLAIKLSNAVMLVIMVGIVIGPIWMLPWPARMFDGPLGTVRYVSGLIGIHFGLILWPCAYLLVRILCKQTRLAEQVKLLVLIAVCLWVAWGNTRELVGLWGEIL